MILIQVGALPDEETATALRIEEETCCRLIVAKVIGKGLSGRAGLGF